jgi:hypothetical protein
LLEAKFEEKTKKNTRVIILIILFINIYYRF